MNFSVIEPYAPMFISGLAVTLEVTGAALVLAFALGFLIAVLKVLPCRPLRWLLPCAVWCPFPAGPGSVPVPLQQHNSDSGSNASDCVRFSSSMLSPSIQSFDQLCQKNGAHDNFLPSFLQKSTEKMANQSQLFPKNCLL